MAFAADWRILAAGKLINPPKRRNAIYSAALAKIC